ncbi:MAG: hypothetical protein M1821_002129 [Bathelium mastoideum]|nr:MAG: hypothetical protein M1821_002129 [Bathelium mastoideum]
MATRRTWQRKGVQWNPGAVNGVAEQMTITPHAARAYMLRDHLRYALSGRWTAPNRDPAAAAPTTPQGKMDQDRGSLVAEFCAITGASAHDAQLALGASQWSLDSAVALYYANQDQEEQEDTPVEATQNEASSSVPPSSGARTLGGDGVPSRPVHTTSSSPGPSQPRNANRTVARGGMRTLRDLQGDEDARGHGHAHSHGDEEDDENGQDFFAGGEKSGLAVQNPKNAQDHIRNMLERARQSLPRPGGDDEEQPRSRFTGQGQTLGGDDTPSQIVPDPHENASRPPPRVNRVLHLWRDGFSIDDGPLCHYDDPQHAATLEMINRGRAPLDILNVERGQEVDLSLDPRKDEDYRPPKKVYKPFSGSGQRLGSPVPGLALSSASSAVPPASSTQGPDVTVDESAPTLRLQIRLADGTNLRTRFNTTHTVNDVYRFVNASNPGSSSRSYVLMTTFPNKDHPDSSIALSEVKELSRGGNVVQKWL